MTPESEQLEAQSRGAIKAWCDDQSVQLEFMLKKGNKWVHKKTYYWFDLESYHYRIAKPKKFYRVCEFGDGSLVLVKKEPLEKQVESSLGFVRWLDERKYYD